MTTPEPVRVGLVGAGPWATYVHGPLLAAHRDLDLAGVWARRSEAAAELAAACGTEPVAGLDGLIERCDALVFAVPPAVQADLALTAARAGRTLLLEKPIAADLAAAEVLRDAVVAGGARTLLGLSWRWNPAVERFLGDVAAGPQPTAGRARFLSGSALAGPFATPWRVDDGALLDVGPHVLDLLDAALGPVTDVAARRDGGVVHLDLTHEGGATSTAALSITHPGDDGGTFVEVDRPTGTLRIDPGDGLDAGTFRRLGDSLVAVHRGTPSPLDVHRGLHLQHLLDRAARALAAR